MSGGRRVGVGHRVPVGLAVEQGEPDLDGEGFGVGPAAGGVSLVELVAPDDVPPPPCDVPTDPLGGQVPVPPLDIPPLELPPVLPLPPPGSTPGGGRGPTVAEGGGATGGIGSPPYVHVPPADDVPPPDDDVPPAAAAPPAVRPWDGARLGEPPEAEETTPPLGVSGAGGGWCPHPRHTPPATALTRAAHKTLANPVDMSLLPKGSRSPEDLPGT
ncbi:hypothetical protein GCM10010339_66610 [Streptomyces alanosinicus]|uniref:Uncharacterized protein n=1 Tax=Streptomyces alanosinicus TaxID=68171 RepID=A0A918YPF7_9ACTN|nr:hypothetical protein GCM10010339_66610 [Streptomyces alanosinicus]